MRRPRLRTEPQARPRRGGRRGERSHPLVSPVYPHGVSLRTPPQRLSGHRPEQRPPESSRASFSASRSSASRTARTMGDPSLLGDGRALVPRRRAPPCPYPRRPEIVRQKRSYGPQTPRNALGMSGNGLRARSRARQLHEPVGSGPLCLLPGPPDTPPLLHQDAAALEEVRAGVGRLHLVVHRVRQRGLHDRVGRVGALPQPSPGSSNGTLWLLERAKSGSPGDCGDLQQPVSAGRDGRLPPGAPGRTRARLTAVYQS